jgi:LPS sulfotransferase NodH
MQPYRSYILCTSPRSGSTLLCKLLSATGIAGHPGSYFHEASIASWQEDLGLEAVPAEPEMATLRKVFAAAIEKGSRGTGLFGLRLQRHSFAYFMEKLAVLHPERPTDLERLKAAFGETLFIHLTRRDKIAQAVSYVRAEQSGLWHRAADGSELERLSDPIALHYDQSALKEKYGRFTRFDRDWQAWFEREKIIPFPITYEDLAVDPQAALRRVLERLGLDCAMAGNVVPGVAKLADATNADWATRLRQDFETATAG